MVTGKDEKRDYSEYSLPRIIELAEQGQVRYFSKTVEHQAENLSFSPEDVCNCLAELNEGCFCHSVKYANQKFWMDVYHIFCQGQSGHQDNLYIKLKLDRDCIWIYLASFHQKDRFI